ncbi:hypothetical protein S40285_09836 [Stachybotrys chlorohalonatus IBT 40285]|uniref:Uncharacterized protein n=1 Tax=Stachybotrys chlorohalonatus (strain IBT 40285) TaxID=1283841 RepID=A0A084QU63_STAC4|nr:hypothetical protein S40285_09836 [Stachybotrys chlorohalonata IBT 40285]
MASYLGLDPARNYSLFTIPATLVLIVGTHAYATLQTPKSYDNTYPRSFKDNIEKDQTIDLPRKQRAIRAEAASQNGFETLGFYAAAVVAANHARLPVDLLNHATLAYVASRLLYTLSYVQFKPTPANSVLRSSVWWVGIGVTSYLWIKAGQVIIIFLDSTTGIPSIMTTRILLAFLFAAAVAFAAPHARFVEDGIYNHDPSVTAAPTPSIHCDNKICDGKTEWCFYWAGVTSYDQSLGPVPGVTRTALGPCPPATFASYLTAV